MLELITLAAQFLTPASDPAHQSFHPQTRKPHRKRAAGEPLKRRRQLFKFRSVGHGVIRPKEQHFARADSLSLSSTTRAHLQERNSMEETEGVRIEDDSPEPRRGRPSGRARCESFSEAEKRAARSERIVVTDALPYGWTAYSESQEGESYRLFREPGTKLLVCSCGDFIFRGGRRARLQLQARPGHPASHREPVSQDRIRSPRAIPTRIHLSLNPAKQQDHTSLLTCLCVNRETTLDSDETIE